MEVLTSLHGSRIGLSKNDDLVMNGQVAVPNVNAQLVALTTETTLTRDANASRVNYINSATGFICTLPAATGTGARYSFVVGATVTSGSHVIKVANATDSFIGRAYVAQDGGDTIVAFEVVAGDDTITLNGTTTGGLLGDRIEVIDVASGKFHVLVHSAATGTEATPFSATVS